MSDFDPKMLEALVCPQTRQQLVYDADRQELVSKAAHLAYPIRDGIPRHVAPAIGREARHLLGHAEPRYPGQSDHVAPVFGFGKGGQPPGTSNGMQLGLAARPFKRLDHPDQPMRRLQAVIQHRQIARLKNVQRERRTRQ